MRYWCAPMVPGFLVGRRGGVNTESGSGVRVCDEEMEEENPRMGEKNA